MADLAYTIAVKAIYLDSGADLTVWMSGVLQEFFRCDYFIDIGAAGLLHKLRCSVERSLAGVDFGGSMSQQDVEALVITMHAAFEESFVRAEDLWAAYLVPPGPAPVSVRTGKYKQYSSWAISSKSRILIFY